MRNEKKKFTRRYLLNSALLSGGGALLFSCEEKNKNQISSNKHKTKSTFNFKMVTTWPKDFPGLGTSASRLAFKINKARAS